VDASRFDALSRLFSQTPSRRRTLQALSGLLLGGMFRRDPAPETLAKKKHGHHHKKKPRCSPNCAGKSCDSDGCGGSCGTCSGGTSCQGGTCVCPGGRTPCGAICCTAPTGSPVASIACDTSSGAPVCACAYRTAEVCAPGCASPGTFTTDCAPFASDFLAAWCPDAGCTPPPG
jgi:hypothetical protein